MRLNKYLAKNLGLSRRQADKLLQANKVLVNEEFAKIGAQVSIRDKVKYQDIRREWIELVPNTPRTALYYKPIFTLVSTLSQDRKETIYTRLPAHYKTYKPAGRLDYMSEGLLVLSQDGDLIQQLTHPRNGAVKKYLVGIATPLEYSHIDKICKGVKIDDYQLRPVEITKASSPVLNSFSYLKLHPKHFWYVFTLHEGRNNQIRKMCAYFQYRVVRLIRIEHGQYRLSHELKQKKVIDLPE